MIIDYLSNAHRYYGLGPRIEAALRYLQDDDFDDLEEGSFVIDLEQEGLRAVRSNFESRPIEGAKYEFHRRSIDVQHFIEGETLCGWAHISQLKLEEYNVEEDYVFGTGEGDLIRARPGTFFIFAPQDGHMANLQPPEASGPVKMKKCTVKVDLDDSSAYCQLP